MSVTLCPSCGAMGSKKWSNKKGYQLMRCVLCDLIFVFPLPTDTESVYTESYFSGGEEYGYVDYDRDKESMRRAFELYIEHIEQTLGTKGTLLDVGCATGYFLDIAKRRGWKVEGVEVSEYASSLGRAKGLQIHTGTLEGSNLPDKSFDVITLFDVIEHVRDPKSVLLTAGRLLKEGGIIAVTTPDTGSVWARMLRSRWQLVVPPEHLMLFNRKNFIDLLAHAGFAPILVTNIGKHFTLPYIFQTLFHWQNLSFWNMLAQATNRGFLSKLKVPVNLHDTFFMLATKK